MISPAYSETLPRPVGPVGSYGPPGSAYASGTVDESGLFRIARSTASEPLAADTALVVRSAPHPTVWTGSLSASTATTLTRIVANPGNQYLNLTSVLMSASAASTTTADQLLSLKYGTGSNCATGTTVLFTCYNVANGGCSQSFVAQPVKLPINVDLCFIDAVAGSKSVFVTGYTTAQ